MLAESKITQKELKELVRVVSDDTEHSITEPRLLLGLDLLQEAFTEVYFTNLLAARAPKFVALGPTTQIPLAQTGIVRAIYESSSSNPLDQPTFKKLISGSAIVDVVCHFLNKGNEMETMLDGAYILSPISFLDSTQSRQKRSWLKRLQPKKTQEQVYGCLGRWISNDEWPDDLSAFGNAEVILDELSARKETGAS